MIQFQDVSYALGGRLLLQEASFLISPGTRTGVLGPNGSGKTTLLRLLAGQLKPDAGEVIVPRKVSFGYLAQHPQFAPGETVFRHVARPSAALAQLTERIQDLEARMERERDPQRLDRLVESHRELQAEREACGGYELEGRAEEVLASLGISGVLFQRELCSLSGGEKNRVALARVLSEEPQVLVLDEPTNYLDLEMIEWLEEFLSSTLQTVVVSSHDRYFLDRIASTCLELRDGKVHVYRGNYQAYARQREEEIAFELKRFRRAQEGIARELEFIRRNFYGQRARQAKSREKRVARLQKEALPPPPVEAEGPRIQFDHTRPGGEDVLRLEGVDCGYGERVILRGVKLELSRGERVALLGPNGCGKTTLLRCMAGELEPLCGRVHRGVRTVPGRYEQECAAIDTARPLFEEIHDLVPRWEDQRVRDLLAAFLFRGDRIHIPVASLSGGEKAKLALLRLILSGSNLLCLDEPTNHLDLHSRAALEEALQEFPETIVFVSHDRYFIERLADRVFILKDGEVRELIGGFSEYREALRRRREEATKRRRESARPRAARPHVRAPRSLDEGKLLREITALEAALRERQSEASRPEVCRSGEQSRRLKREMADLEERIAALYRRWEENL